MVWEQAEADPDRIALRVEGGADVTYAELRRRSKGLAARLIDIGVRGDPAVFDHASRLHDHFLIDRTQ